MARAQSTGYIVTPITVVFSGTQTLASLMDNEWTNLSDEIDNSTDKYLLADFELVLGSAAFTGTDSAVELYVVRTQDGTNYPAWTGDSPSDAQANQNNPCWVKSTTGTTAAQRIVFECVEIPPGKYKIGVRNRGNVTLASSGNTLTLRPHSVEMSA